MHARRDYHARSQSHQARRQRAAMSAPRKRREPPKSRRCVTSRNIQEPFAPPEHWHEPTGRGGDYQVIIQQPGHGYRHVVTAEEVRERLSQLPAHFLRDLEVVQLSRMTRKKQSFPCYGMQWGPTLYLYPLEESLVETFYTPPSPNVVNESKMYGGRWDEPETGIWTLTWTEATIRDFYLNNILIHELGHLLDDRNTSYIDRERYAEWFAVAYGYQPSGGSQSRRPHQKVRRRHHSV